VDLKWDPVPGATGYKVWIYNGIEYEAFDVGNVTQWTTRNKGIWPTPEEIAAGWYKLHHDGKGTELARDPSPVYRNSGGKYTTNKNYWFRVTAYQALGESALSEAFMPTIPDREDLGVEDFWTYVSVPKGKVNAATGNLVLEDTDLEIPGRGPVVTIRRTYNSRSAEDGPFGLGWTFSLGMRIREDVSGNVFWTDEDGTVHRFTKNADGSYTLRQPGEPLAATKELGMADNRVTNPGMERVNSGLPESWTLVTSGDSGTMAADSGQKHSGARSVRLTSQSTTSGGGLGFVAAIQDIPLALNTTYTLSGYIKTLNLNGANAFFNVYQLNANKQPVANPWTDNRYSQLSGTHDWTLRQLTFTTGPNTAYVRIYLEVDHRSDTASGTAWFDDIQLERGEVSTGYNPLENSSFEQQLNFWQNVSGSGGAGSIDATQAFDGTRSLKMSRAAATDPALAYRQRIDLYQSTPEPITVSGMSKASGVQNAAAGGPNDDYAIWVEAVHSDGTSTSGGARFALGTHDWQRASVTLHPTKPIQYVNVNVVFRGQNTGTCGLTTSACRRAGPLPHMNTMRTATT